MMKTSRWPIQMKANDEQYCIVISVIILYRAFLTLESVV